MNTRQKDLVIKLLTGHYLRYVRPTKRGFSYRLYVGNQNPVMSIHDKVVDQLTSYMVKKDGKLVISRQKIRREDGRTSIQRLYRKFMKTKKALSNGSNDN